MTAGGGAAPGERIARYLSRAGVASRREAERLVAAGRVRIGGAPCRSPAERVGVGVRVEVDGKRVAGPQRTRLWRYHKPAGVLVSRTDPRGRRVLAEVLPPELATSLPVGRLDLASEGLLLLTNDGALKRHLELPATGLLRVYRVRVRGRPDTESLAPLVAGLNLRGERFRPMQLDIERQGTSNAWLRVGLAEGRYREIRRALAHVGFPVGRLIRVAYGPFRLGNLPPGGCMPVPDKELRKLGAGSTP